MPRSLKPQKVDTYVDHKRRVEIDLMLDRNENTFFAEVQLEKIEADSCAGLKPDSAEARRNLHQGFLESLAKLEGGQEVREVNGDAEKFIEALKSIPGMNVDGKAIGAKA